MFFIIFVTVKNLPVIVNPKNAIQSMIPERLVKLVPPAFRDKWADRIVAKVKAHNPALFAAIGQWTVVPEEERRTVMNEILHAAEQIHWEIRDESQ